MDFLSTNASIWQGGIYSHLAAWGRGLVCVCLLVAGLQVAHGNDAGNVYVDALLMRNEAPHGVVFEIVEGDELALEALLPKLRSAIERIRARFPHTEFAVVSHGREEFALQSRYQSENAQIHQQVQALVAEDVPVHVCATHASWYGVSPEDFPAYVNVAPTGPGQIELYLELDYDLIVIQSSN